MRIVAIVLLLANLAFFAWSAWLAQPASAGAGASKVPSLQLAAARRRADRQAGTTIACRRLGPFADANAAAPAVKALGALQFAPRQVQAERQVPAQYLVYIDGIATAAEQRRTVARLSRAGIGDAAAVDSSPGNLRVSVGLFEDEGRAVTRSALARAAGFDAKMETRYRDVTETWVNLQVAPNAALPPPSQLAGVAPGPTWSDCPSDAVAPDVPVGNSG